MKGVERVDDVGDTANAIFPVATNSPIAEGGSSNRRSKFAL